MAKKGSKVKEDVKAEVAAPVVQEEVKPAPVENKCRICGEPLPDKSWLSRCVKHGTLWPTDP